MTRSKSPSGMFTLAVLGLVAVKIAFEVLKAVLTSPWFYVAIVVAFVVWIAREAWLRRRRRAAWDHPRACGADALCTHGVSDHPRSRGADSRCSAVAGLRTGSPSLARGRLLVEQCLPLSEGITLARAGPTARRAGPGLVLWDHPRSRGADLNAAARGAWVPGSPSLARGRHPCGLFCLDDYRITLARAGPTLPDLRR